LIKSMGPASSRLYDQGGTARPQAVRLHVPVSIFEGGGGGGAFLSASILRTRKEFLSCQGLLWPRGSNIFAISAERRTAASANGTLCSASPHVTSFLACAPSFLFLRITPHLRCFAQRTRISASARSIGFCHLGLYKFGFKFCC